METTTPMLKQYHSIKNQYQDCILFFRLGDFYEMFFEDAQAVSKELNLVLTARGKGAASKVPMCGFPHHAADNYIPRLIKAGFKIAICDQMEDPSVAKGIVKRDVTRIITSGTFLDENNADARYLLALSPNNKNIGIAFADPTSGAIQTNQYSFSNNRLTEIIACLPISECIFPQSLEDNIKKIFAHPLLKLKNIALSPYDDWCFNTDIARKSLCEHFAIANLHGFGIEDMSCAISGTGALLEYLKAMNKQPMQHMDKISLYTDDDYVFIAPAAHRGLELDTLIKTIDHTLTSLGKRMFRFWFFHPLKNMENIKERQQAITLLKKDADILNKLKEQLNKIPDIEKNISRLSCGYTHAKDLMAIRNTLNRIPEIQKIIRPLSEHNALFSIKDIPDLREHLTQTINEDIPLSHYEGKVICRGYHDELDELRGIQENGRQWLKKLQEEESKRTGIPSLKIGFNKVFGYYIEITKTHTKSVPEDFIRKQTLVNAERYITPKLKEYEEKILTAQDKILKIENDIIKALQKKILDNSLELHQLCQSLATLDTLYSLTILAQSPGYVQPEITNSNLLQINAGRHPVVEKTSTKTFIANDTTLDCDENHLIILTGPNMAGKSTYIRQTAILTIMAQIGSFIPAASAHIGIVDKIFTRIGAHDDISKGQSTFMVEMNETADILNNLTDRSLVILDEIGRGTSTYDGLSLAWALAEHLKNTKTRTLFATHFHEITALSDKHTGVKNYNVAVKEWKNEIVFLHKIIPGSTDDSYGIYVAKLAGIPKTIITRAKTILTQLELQNNLKKNLIGQKNKKEEQLELFTTNANPVDNKLHDMLADIDINNITPLDALNKLQKLKKISEEL
ncbi:DNA mismatch repair protein MutS [hydrothermal vent metagenome]|uniref:DNA mismatch repair protein MutS n=1 Tax=hydrothermal vent metagenome TaxID=652676 RepID=A0A3B1D476_9ZZZZ